MNAPLNDPSALLAAALSYGARGWPVFPCNPKNKQPLLAGDRDAAGNPIKGTGGVKKATTDPEQIHAWWKRWPTALVGLATGHPTKGTETAEQPAGLRLFVVDFDPRTDKDTGEVWTLERLKQETEQQLGCALPPSMAALTPSDGVHLYLLIGDDGPAITNRGNLPEHVDVRGLGGYVIAPPSIMGPNAAKGQGGLKYRWLRGEQRELLHAPPQLLEILRDRGAKPAAAPPADPQRFQGSTSSSSSSASIDDAVRKYCLSALDGELKDVRQAPSGRRNAQLNTSALKIASLVAAGGLEGTLARHLLEAAARDNAGHDDERQLIATIDSGWTAGLAKPRDLAEIAAAARSRSERQPAAARRAAPPPQGQSGPPFRNGSMAGDRQPARGEAGKELSAADVERLQAVAAAWLTRRLEADLDADELRKIAFGAGGRISADLLDEDTTRAALWQAAENLADLQCDELDQALEDGITRGYDPAPTLLDFKCARYPLTDFGTAERFRDRYGADYRFTTAQGWLGWDGHRWKVLDQDKDTAPAEVIAAGFETIRAMQREAKRVRETGTKWELVTRHGPRGGEYQVIDEDADPNPTALDYWIAKGAGFWRYSEALAAFGRASEAAGKPGAIAGLARRWLTVPIEAFDCEQMAVNALNGTLRFSIERDGDKRKVTVKLDKHRREDLITKLAPVAYNPEAPATRYDASIAWAQPDPQMRRYVHQVAGYAITGHTGEHKLWFNYGRGRNGKSLTIDSWCGALGDYSGTVGIESFLDQGIKKRGDAATPDLAKLGGVRMLRASEPERGAKLNSALIKAATGGEPMSVRALNRGFFDLLPRFKLLMSGNSKPQIPDTDEGIWTRLKLVPWKRNIDRPLEDPYAEQYPQWHEPGAWPAKDPELGEKIKAAELEGVFARLVDGLVDYLKHGFVEPESVTQATAEYRNQSDPLGRFLELCTERDPASRVKSSELHEVFAAWCKAAGEKEWSQKGFADAMIDKGFTKTRSDGMRWEKIKLLRQVSDFVDAEGRVRLLSDDLSREPAAVASNDDEDLPV
jgi:putative DNA primase/helicase